VEEEVEPQKAHSAIFAVKFVHYFFVSLKLLSEKTGFPDFFSIATGQIVYGY
jgi:hypothetical protein